MILKLNHLKVKAAATTQRVIETVYALVEEGLMDQGQFARLQVELDWIQYKSNFREAVTATQGYNSFGQPAPINRRCVPRSRLELQLRRGRPARPRQ